MLWIKEIPQYFGLLGNPKSKNVTVSPPNERSNVKIQQNDERVVKQLLKRVEKMGYPHHSTTGIAPF